MSWKVQASALALGVALCSTPAYSQETGGAPPPASNETPPLSAEAGKQVYTPADFARFAPKTAYVSLRRAKEFAMVGPATRTMVEIGLNLKGTTPPARFTVVPPGGMCQLKIRVEQSEEVDRELVEWLRKAYDAAG